MNNDSLIKVYENDGSPSKVNIYNLPALNMKKYALGFENESHKSMIMINEIDNKVTLFNGDIVSFASQQNGDETLDNANVSVNSTVNDFVFPAMSKCLVFMDVDQKVPKTDFTDDLKLKYFEKDGFTPKNHEQYILIRPQVVEKPVSDGRTFYLHGFNLVEPTYLLRYAYTGTSSDTNMKEISVYDVSTGSTITYTQDENNCLTILERQLKITGIKTDVEDTTWFSRIYIPEKVKKILSKHGIGSSQSFASAYLYDTVFKIGKSIKRYPVLYFNPDYDPNMIHTWDTDETKREFILDYITYDGSDKDSISMSNLLENAKTKSVANSSEKYQTNILCEAQNMNSTNLCYYPSEADYVSITGNDTDLLLKGKERANYTIKLPHKIKRIEWVKYLSHLEYMNPVDSTELRITSKKIKCIEVKEWQLLSEQQKDETLYYVNETNEIHCNHFLTALESGKGFMSSINNLYIGFKIAYYAESDCLTSNGNGKLQGLINQIDSTLDSSLFGSWMENYQKLQKSCDLLISKVITNYNEVFPNGTNVIDGENIWIINQSNIEMHNNCYDVTYTLSLNISKRSEEVCASSKIENKFIDSDKATKRLCNIHESIYFDLLFSKPEEKKFDGMYLKNFRLFFNNYITDKKQNLIEPKMTYVRCFFKNDKNDINNDFKVMRLPLAKYIFGNSLLFNVSFNNHRCMVVGGGLVNVALEREGSNSYKSYTNPFAKVEKMEIAFHYDNRKDVEDNLNIEYQSIANLPIYANQYKNLLTSFNSSYPEISNAVFLDVKKSNYLNIYIPNYMILKDTYEVPNITYQLECIENNPSIIIDSSFVENCGLLKSIDNLEIVVVIHDDMDEEIIGERGFLPKEIIHNEELEVLEINMYEFVTLNKRYVSICLKKLDSKNHNYYNKIITRRVNSSNENVRSFFLQTITRKT